MTGPVPPPLAAAAVSAVGNQPPAEGPPTQGQQRAGGQPVSATVVSVTRQGALIEAAGQRLLVTGAPPLPKGATLSLELAGGGRAGAARLLAIAGRALEPPVMIRLQALPTAVGTRAPAEAPPPPAAGVQVEARLLGPDGRPAGPPIPLRLTARLAAGDDPGGRRGTANGQPTPASPGQAPPAGRPLTAEAGGPTPRAISCCARPASPSASRLRSTCRPGRGCS